MSEVKPWTAEEDEYCVWLFFCNKIGSFPNPSEIPGNNHTPDQILDRFLTVLKNKLFLERVRQKCHGDIFQVRGITQFSPIEDYYYVNAMRILQTQLAKPIMKHLPHLFHLSRNNSQFETEKFMLLTKGQLGYDQQLQQFLEFKNHILNTYTQHSQISPTTLDDIKPYFFETSPHLSIFPEVGQTIDEIDKSVQDSFVRGDLAALKGKSANIMAIKKPLTFIGRNSQFIDVDIDLTYYHTSNISRKHASIKLCTDLHFYIECIGSNLIINGKILLTGEKALLQHRDIIDIGGCLFIFFERLDFMNKLRNAK